MHDGGNELHLFEHAFTQLFHFLIAYEVISNFWNQCFSFSCASFLLSPFQLRQVERVPLPASSYTNRVLPACTR